MKKWEASHTIIIVAMALVAGIVCMSILRDRWVNVQLRNVTALGQGRVAYQPDTATILLGVQIDKTPKAEDALNTLNAKISAVKKAISDLKIKPEDIDTKNYALTPVYDYNNGVQLPTGFSANQQLAVKIRDLNKNKNLINDVVAAVGKAGANQINGVSFTVSNLEDLKQQARLLAIADAKNKAAKMAEAAGVSLDQITNWYENYQPLTDSSGVMADGKGGGGGNVSPQIAAGSNEVVMEINLTYNLK